MVLPRWSLRLVGVVWDSGSRFLPGRKSGNLDRFGYKDAAAWAKKAVNRSRQDTGKEKTG